MREEGDLLEDFGADLALGGRLHRRVAGHVLLGREAVGERSRSQVSSVGEVEEQSERVSSSVHKACHPRAAYFLNILALAALP